MIFITAADVACLIGMNSAAHFLARRVELEQDEDFPPPLPTCRRPLKWRRDAVTAWVSERGLANAPARQLHDRQLLAEAARP